MLNDDVFPFMKSGPKNVIDDSEEALENSLNEARSLLFVGITRARQMLYMIAQDGGGAKPSRLIEEFDRNAYVEVR